VATQAPGRFRVLNVEDKGERVYRYHMNTMEALSELVAAMGVDKPSELKPFHVSKRLDSCQVTTYEKAYNYLEDGAILKQTGEHPYFHKLWSQSSAETFDAVEAK
jgi:hypothetical protein